MFHNIGGAWGPMGPTFLSFRLFGYVMIGNLLFRLMPYFLGRFLCLLKYSLIEYFNNKSLLTWRTVKKVKVPKHPRNRSRPQQKHNVLSILYVFRLYLHRVG